MRQSYAVALFPRGTETSTRVAEEIQLANDKPSLVQTNVSAPKKSWNKSDRNWPDHRTGIQRQWLEGRSAFLALVPENISTASKVGVMGAVYLSQAMIPDMFEGRPGFISLTGDSPALRERAGCA